MKKLRLPAVDSLTWRAAYTAGQGFVGTLLGLTVGLIYAVYNVPGVPEVVFKYVMDHMVEIALLFGLPIGVTSFVSNYFLRDLKKY